MNDELLDRIATALETIAQAMQAQDAKEYQWTPEGLPICPKHGEVMKKREKQGDSWYSHRVIDPATGEELYCRGYAGKNSPGWNLEPAADAQAEPEKDARQTPTSPQDYPTKMWKRPNGARTEPRQAEAQKAVAVLDEYFPRPEVQAQAAADLPADPNAARREFNTLVTEVIKSGFVDRVPFSTIATSANVDGWPTALQRLRLAVSQARC